MKKSFFIIILYILFWNISYADIPRISTKISTVNSDTFVLTVTVPPRHHAYLDKGEEGAFIPISLETNNEKAALQQLQKPIGVYEQSVKATILREKGDFTFQLTTHQPVILNLKYQLCNEVTNQCYRPQTAKIDIPFSQNSSNSNLSLMDQLVQLFEKNKHDTLIIFALMFLAGFLSVATPCVYPMLPITAMFIIRRAGGIVKQEKYHAFVYWLGIIFTYMILGLIAGMTGGAFNMLMQSALFNLLFAGLFGFFAIALLGFYDIAFLQNEVGTLDQKALQIKGLGGTWLIGAVAGLVISPCVGPIVFALLLQVADNIAEKSASLAILNQTLTFWDKFLISSQGSLMMAGFGLGVGLPFFLVGVIKFKLLPKAGYWMNKIKYAFGLLVLYFAYLYLEKGLGVLGFNHQTILYLTLGMLGIWVAIVHCNVLTLLSEEAFPSQKLQRFIGIVSLILGCWLFVIGLGQIPFIHAAVAMPNKIENTRLIQQEAGINWYRNFEAAQKIAKETGKPLFIDFYASWCANCLAFAQETANNKALNQALRDNAIAVKLVDQEPDFETFRGKSEHRQLKIGLPYFAILNPDGSTIWSGTDYQASEKMISVLKDQTKH